MGRKTAEKRREIVEAVKKKDEEKKLKRGQALTQHDLKKRNIKTSATFRDMRRAETERKKQLMGVCCEDRKGFLFPQEPLVWRRCADCPKVVAMTEAGSPDTEAHGSTEGGSKLTGVVSK